MDLQVNMDRCIGRCTLSFKQKEVVERIHAELFWTDCVWAEFFRDVDDDGSVTRSLLWSWRDLEELKKSIDDGSFKDHLHFLFFAEEIKDRDDIWAAIRLISASGIDVAIMNSN